jgi:c-di-GMP-related signal transduction protein
MRGGSDFTDGGSDPNGQFLVGRQPIFDSRLEVHGFELLFRTAGPCLPDGDAMTADVLLHAGLDVGLDRLVGTKTAFVNAGRPYLVGEREIPLPSEQVVIEVLETVEPDEEVLAGCRRLRDQGFTLALDDYPGRYGDDALLELAAIVKLDVLANDPTELAELVDRCSAHGARLVAEKVETVEQLERCQALGFDLFQGYLLSRPALVSGRALPAGRLNCLRLVQRLCDPDVTVGEVGRIIETDPGLSVRFLRAAGAGASNGMRRSVRSIGEGAVLLGQRRIRSWAMLMLLSDAGTAVPDQLPLAMTRARLCELIAGAMDPQLADSAFTVGLLSSLELLLSAPLAMILENLALPLADELVDALLDRQGRLGLILADAVDWETGQPVTLASGLSGAVMMEMCMEAASWADRLCAPLLATGALSQPA